MRFRVLGTVEVFVHGVPVRLAGLRQRRLLAFLLVNADRAVSLDALIEAVWDMDPPVTAKRQVQNSVSALRRLLADRAVDAAEQPVIAAEGSGYRLRLGDAELDARLFQDQVVRAQELASTGQVGQAAAELRAAFQLWRGSALAGLTGRVLEAAAARLDEQRRAATEECLELELRLGHHAGLVGELTELVAVYPLRERLVGQLMRALHRSGRQADALQAYRRFRDRLADELGLDPGVALQELHTAILNNEVDPAAGGLPAGPANRPVVPVQLPADIPGFTGRADHLKDLDQLLAADRAGSGTAVVISAIAGTAGVGKTALAVHWGQRVRHHFPDGQLYANLRGFDPAGTAVDPADALRGFLDALDMPPERIPVDLAGRSALYRSTVAGRRLLVLLDNARDADQVRPLLPGSPTCLVVITSRNLLSGLVAAEGARPVTLDLFDRAEAQQMLAVRLGRERLAADPAAVDEIVTRCARLPLALAVAAARAATRPGFPLAALAADMRTAWGGLDAFTGADPVTDVRAVFSWSYQQLSQPAKRLFRLLGLAPGPDIATPAAASLAGVPLRRTHRTLAELAGAHLVAEHTPGRYALHDLLRAYATELADANETPAERHAALHRLLDHYLHTARAAAMLLQPSRDPIELDPTEPGTAAEDILDHRQALAWFTAEHQVLLGAVGYAAELGHPRHAWRLAWTLVDFFQRRGHWHDQATTQRTGLAAAHRVGDRVGLANTHRDLARAYVKLGRYDEAQMHYQDALDLFGDLGDLTGKARTHRALGAMLDTQDRHPEALHHARQALDLYRAAGDRSGEASTLNAVGWAHAMLGDHVTALVYCEQALALLPETGDRHGEANTWDSLGYAHHRLGHHRQASACYQRALDLYSEIGDRYEEAQTLTRLGETHRAAGAADAARDTLRRAVAILDELGHPDAEAVRERLAAG